MRFNPVDYSRALKNFRGITKPTVAEIRRIQAKQLIDEIAHERGLVRPLPRPVRVLRRVNSR